MENFLDSLRHYDFTIYTKLYQLGVNSYWWDRFFYFFAKYGIVFFFLSFIYLVYKKKIPAFLCTLLAMGVGGTVDFLVYVFWRRPLPFITHSDVIATHLPANYGELSSFPSSHTYIAFAIAISITLYGHKKLGFILFILALLIAIGRVGTGLNYPSDVIGGILLGLLSGILVYFLFRNWEKREWHKATTRE